MKRKVVAVLALGVALLAQLTVVNGLALPGGGTPDLVLLCVIALGMTAGPVPGVIAGFCAGLALDLAPPASQLAGQYALVLCLVGYGAGRLRGVLRYSAMLAIAVAAALAVAGEALAAILTLALDTPEVTWAAVRQVLPPSTAYDLLLTPVVLLCTVRMAVALGVSLDPLDDSPALEAGGSAGPAAVAGAVTAAGRLRLRQPGQRLAVGGDRRAAASGRWLVGDIAEAAPAVGAVGWLDGPVRSRRARREQARLTAMLTGATPRRGAFWVGRRPPGLVAVQPPRPAGTSKLARLRPASGVAGSAASTARPAPALLRRPVRLRLGGPQPAGLAGYLGGQRAGGDGGRRDGRPRGDRRRANWQWLLPHGPDRHGLNGPGLPSIGFGGGSAWAGRGRGGGAGGAGGGRRVPKIAFGTGGLTGAGRSAGRGVPRIAFGTGSLAGADRADGRRVPRIAFGTGGLPGSGGAAGSGVPRIAFGTGSLARANRADGRRVPRIAFGTPGTALGIPGSSGRGARHGAAAPKFRAKSRFAAGPGLAGTAAARGGGRGFPVPPSRRAAAAAGSGRRVKQPRFGRGGRGPAHPARPRQPKTARMSAGRGLLRLPWLRRAGDRSAVWRIGSSRIGISRIGSSRMGGFR